VHMGHCEVRGVGFLLVLSDANSGWPEAILRALSPTTRQSSSRSRSRAGSSQLVAKKFAVRRIVPHQMDRQSVSREA
jgi:hypothetical protein